MIYRLSHSPHPGLSSRAPSLLPTPWPPEWGNLWGTLPGAPSGVLGPGLLDEGGHAEMTEGQPGREEGGGLGRQGDNEEITRQLRLQGWLHLPLAPSPEPLHLCPSRHAGRRPLLATAAPCLPAVRGSQHPTRPMHRVESTVQGAQRCGGARAYTPLKPQF